MYLVLLLAVALAAPARPVKQQAGAARHSPTRVKKQKVKKPSTPVRTVVPIEELDLSSVDTPEPASLPASLPASVPAQAVSAPASPPAPASPSAVSESSPELVEETEEEAEDQAETALAPAAPKSEPAEKPPPGLALGLIFGAKVGGVLTFTGPLRVGALVGLELGYRLPWFDRLIGLSVEPTFANPAGSARLSGVATSSTSRIFSVALLPSLNIRLGPGLLRALAGGIVERYRIESTVGTDRQLNELTALSFTAGVGYLIFLGPGGLGIEVRYRLLPYDIGLAEVEGFGLTATAGYLLLF